MPEFPILVRPDSLARQAYAVLRRAIRDGDIAANQYFSESEIAAKMDVSRTPVREALLDLFREGLVEIVPKRGFRLAPVDDAAIGEMRALRTALERLVVETLCTVSSERTIALLDAEIEEQRSMGDPVRDMFALDERFHYRMAELAGLPQTASMLLAVRGKMYLIASGAGVTKLRSEAVVDEHAAIVRAIERHDVRAATSIVSDHVSRSIAAFEAARATARIATTARG